MKSLNCWRTQRALTAADREELPPAARRFVDRHLAACPRCAEDERWRRLTRQALHAQGFVGAPEGFAARALQRCERVRRRRAVWGAAPLVGQLAGVGAAVALCVFGARTARHSPSTPAVDATVHVAALPRTIPVAPAVPVQPAAAPGSSRLSAPPGPRVERPVRVVASPSRASRQRRAPVRRRRRAGPGPMLVSVKSPSPQPSDLPLRQSTALLAEGQYRAALAHCQEAVGQPLSVSGRRRVVQLVGRLHAASGDVVLEQALGGGAEPTREPNALAPEASPRDADSSPEGAPGGSVTTQPLPEDPVALKQSADALARSGADPTLVAARYREAQRALRRAVAQKRDPKALLALAGAYEAVAERTSAVKAYSEVVENFPDSKESRTAAQRLAQLT